MSIWVFYLYADDVDVQVLSERSVEAILEDASAGALVIEVDQPVSFFSK